MKKNRFLIFVFLFLNFGCATSTLPETKTNESDPVKAKYLENAGVRFGDAWHSQIRINLDRIRSQAKIKKIEDGAVLQTYVSFEVRNDGTVSNIRVTKSSGVEGVDIASQKAVEASSPLDVLPFELQTKTNLRQLSWSFDLIY